MAEVGLDGGEKVSKREGGGKELGEGRRRRRRWRDRIVEGEGDEERGGTREVGEGKHWSNS